MTTAYDYENQVWKHGVSGAEVRLAQLEAEHALLTGPRVDEYLKFMGKTMTCAQVASAVEVLERGIEAMRFEIAHGKGRLAVLADYATSTL